LIDEPSLPTEKNHNNSRPYAQRRSLESRLEEIKTLLGLDLNLKQIKKMTGLSPSTVRTYASKLRSEINKTVDFKEFGECPECRSTSIQRMHDRSIEYVCGNCGLVLGKEQEYGEGYERFVHQDGPAPVCNLSFGKSLGDTLPQKELYKVLGKAPEGKKDLPIRTRQIQTIIKYYEHPKVRKLLEYGSKISKEHGLLQDHVFADTYGRKLRDLGAFLAASNKRVGSYRRFSNTVFYLTLKKFDPDKAEKIKADLSLREKDLEFVSNLLTLLKDYG